MKSMFIIIIIGLLPKPNLSCGQPSIKPSIKTGRIMNGDPAVPNSWPWVVSLRHLSKISGKTYRLHICGGSLISSEFVLTAAHCVDGYTPSQLNVVIGSNYLDEENYYELSEIYIHPDYFLHMKKNDIALIRLSKRIEFTTSISTICLPDSHDVSLIFNKDVVVVGWGSTSGENSRDKISNGLLQATLKIQNSVIPNICKEYDSFVYCALDPTSKKSNICFGDSGGPLMFFRQNKWFLYGASSFVTIQTNNFSCVNTDASYFVMIPNYIDWIKNLTQKIEVVAETRPTEKTTTSPRTSQQPKCGIPVSSSKKIPRIMSGVSVGINSWPWMTSIRIKSEKGFEHKCGGVLISNEHVLTAAHCVYDYTASDLLIVLGVSNLSSPLRDENKYSVSSINVHPGFVQGNPLNGLVVLKLSRKIDDTRSIFPICLPPNKNETFIHEKTVIITGWGNSDGLKSSDHSDTLQQATMKIINNMSHSICKKYEPMFYCAFDATNKLSNICYGDAGGPLMFRINDRWYLYGTALFTTVGNSSRTCKNNEPSYFAKIPNHLDWIIKNLGA